MSFTNSEFKIYWLRFFEKEPISVDPKVILEHEIASLSYTKHSVKDSHPELGISLSLRKGDRKGIWRSQCAFLSRL